MTTKPWSRVKRSVSACLGALAGVTLAMGAAVAQDEYTSDFIDSDSEIYDFYDGGFDEADTSNDWYYDYYELDDQGLSTEYSPAGITESYDEGFEYDWDFEWGDSDATDLGSDDAGDEGAFDL